LKPRDAFHALMSFEKPDTLCQFEWGYWDETVRRWRGEGLPEGVNPWDDCGIIHYFRPPMNRRYYPEFEKKTLEDDADSRIVQNEFGVILRENKRGMSLPQFLKHPVSNRDDFEKIKERLNPEAPGRYGADWDQWAAWSREAPHLICVGTRENGFFGWFRELMGLESLLTSYVDQPELIHEMCRFHLDYLKRLAVKTMREVKLDFVFMWEDMSYKNGPLISPAFFREFMLPYYKEIVDFYKQMGARWVTVDSDGDVTQLIPLFVEAGIDGLLPFEVAAGMDVMKIREAFPKLLILGGIDKRALALGRDAIDAELESRLPGMLRQGGYLPTLDHHVHPEVPYANFKYYLAKCRELYKA